MYTYNDEKEKAALMARVEISPSVCDARTIFKLPEFEYTDPIVSQDLFGAQAMPGSSEKS